jgi:tetratricopeptide (TPR) repeat protein
VSENLRVVLQQYPYNEEANILNWRIRRIEDIDQYNRDIRSAVEEARTAVNTPAAADAYANLQTIKKLEPDYPGIDALIYQAEISLGLRSPPQTEENRNLALDLYNEALEIYNQGDSDAFEDALDRLNQALVINPEYADARELRNTINAEKGGTVATTLASSEDMQFYLQAVRLVGDNRPEQALPIIRRLWNNEANRNYKGLVDLKSSVERALGVN